MTTNLDTVVANTLTSSTPSDSRRKITAKQLLDEIATNTEYFPKLLDPDLAYSLKIMIKDEENGNPQGGTRDGKASDDKKLDARWYQVTYEFVEIIFDGTTPQHPVVRYSSTWSQTDSGLLLTGMHAENDFTGKRGQETIKPGQMLAEMVLKDARYTTKKAHSQLMQLRSIKL